MIVKPAYKKLFQSGRLKQLASQLEEIARECTLCPHRCGVDRTRTKSGRCRSGFLPIVSSWNAHFGEEPPLVGRRGSGTIFFTNCNLACIFCQNYDVSHLGYGKEVSCRDLALMMITLKEKGCHNINFVTPTHMVHTIVKALLIAVPMGLNLPLVYNSGGYDSVEILRMLEDVFDIYMPDLKYSEEKIGHCLSGVKGYPETAMNAIREMHRQVGDLKMDEERIAYRGLLVRHLVLPDGRAGSRAIIDFLSGLSRHTYLNIMDQYRPLYRARECPEICRRVTIHEIDDTVDYARKAGMTRVIF